MTGADLTDRFLALLIRAHGGTKTQWRRVLGPLRIHPRATHPHCNWEYAPHGSFTEIAAVEDLSDRLRLEHPLVTEQRQ